MIDRVALAALPPARRARLIYGEAQAALSKQLWQAALGTPGRGDDSAIIRDATPQTSLDALIALMTPETEPAPRIVPHTHVPTQAIATPAPSAPNPATTTIEGLGANARYASTLQAAAQRTGIPAAALAAIIDAEAGKARDGSWQTYSRNPRSSAAGLGQFLNRTWEGMAESKGTWLHDLASANGWLGTDGKLSPDARGAVLALRYDPTAAINGIADYAKRNLDGMRRAGVSANGEIGATARLAYLGHHLGLGDAIRFLRDGGLSQQRARILLDAQIGATASEQRIEHAGDATTAHRDWLLGYLDRKIQPGRYAAAV